MFKTVLQQHSFQEIVKFLNDFSTAHHTKSKDKYVARIVSPENILSLLILNGIATITKD